MRFTATIGDSKAVEIFIKVVGIASKLCKKKMVVRITPNELSFVSAYNLREGLCIDFRMFKDQLFCTWIFDGISPENNAIFFELPTDDLVHSLQAKENQMKLKLTKKDNVPHLRIELNANCIVNEIPIVLILVRSWPDYNPPNMGQPSVALNLPPVRNLSKILCAVKNIGAKNVAFRVNNVGEFGICAMTDMAKIDVYARDLTNLSMSGVQTPSQRGAIDDFSSIVLDLRALYSFVSSLSPYVARLALKIFNGRGATLCANEPECQLSFSMAGQHQD